MTVNTAQTKSLDLLLKDEQFAPLREKLIEKRILTVDDLKSISLWAFLNSHDLYTIHERQTICESVLRLIKPLPIDEPSTTEQETDISTPYGEVYGLNPSDYEQYSIDECDFSVRIHSRLEGRGVETIADLLELSDADLLALSGFGSLSVSNVRLFLKKLSQGQIKLHSLDKEPEQLPVPLLKHRDELIAGDFTFVAEHSFAPALLAIIDQFKEAHEQIDAELIQGIVNGTSAATDIYQMLLNFTEQNKEETACDMVVQTMPDNYLAMEASFIVRCYTGNYRTPGNTIGATPIEGETLRQFIYGHPTLIMDNEPQLMKLLDWCRSDVRTRLNGFIDTKLEKDRVRQVIRGRAHGETLTAIGDQIGITRERVRQIEAKVIKTSHTIFQREQYIYKLFLDFGTPYITGASIAEYIGEYGPEAIYFFKEYSGRHYFYEKRLDLFSLDPIVFSEEMQEYVDSLPDLFIAEKFDYYIAIGCHDYGFSEIPLRLLLTEDYRRTGDTYHRSRLSLAAVYSEILRKHYPDGIHADDEAMVEFRRLVLDEFNIDLGDRSNHAVITIITRVGMLCGRGRYKYKENRPYISVELKKRIHDYVSSSPSPIMLINSIYTEFEEDLQREGIDNRYYLLGILKEEFGEEWSFRRDYLSKDASVSSFYDAVASFIARAKVPVTKAEIQRQFPGITDIVLSLSVSDPETLNLFGSYINASRMKLSTEEIQYLHDQIETTLQTSDVCYARDLFGKVNAERPELLSRNFILIPFGLFSLVEYLFSGDYSFSRPFIAREGSTIRSIATVLREMVTESDTISTAEILDFAAEHHFPLASILDFATQCNATHLMISDQELASIEYIGVTEDIARQVEHLIAQEITEATPIAHLSCINKLPALNVEWNAWLIYSILRKWSQELKVGTSKSLYRLAYPIVAPAGMPLEVEYDDSISHSGILGHVDNLDDIEALIEQYIAEDLGDIDEL